MTQRLTVGLNGSPEGAAAARWAAREADLRGASLDLVHVEEWLEHPPLALSTTEERTRWADTVLKDSADEARRTHPSLDIRSRKVRGLPGQALAHAAEESDMLVIGSRALGIIAGFLLGSTASATLSETGTPVVLVRAAAGEEHAPDGGRTQRSIVVGMDISRRADAVLAFAFAEAAIRDSGLVFVHGCAVPPVLSYAPALDASLAQEMVSNASGALNEILSPWRSRFPSVAVDLLVGPGPAPIQILRAATDADLVVVGRRTRDAPIGAHVGPTAHAVLHHAVSPVAVVAHA
ncbi:universal stress protein [Streptomyces sp. NPDC057690]|uniref:universal stress protein n=1 Tax=Streptomyces sp. NPDC057690 TaxID=3346214 RepID=UPI0036CAA124